MRNRLFFAITGTLFLLACSPRDFLSRRLAADLIAASDSFKTIQNYTLQTGVITNQNYVSPEYLVLQHRGWISASTVPCRAGLSPPPCWDVNLTPSGVDSVRTILSADDANKPSLTIPAARREFIAVTGISSHDNLADVDFTWKWVPLNEIGAALYSADVHYKSTVGFRRYDDGWRLLQTNPPAQQTMDEGLKNAEPTP